MKKSFRNTAATDHVVKRYNEFLLSELELLPKTNWNWFLTDIGKTSNSAWYSNGHVAMNKSPVKAFPVTPPPGMPGGARRAWVTNPVTLPDNVRDSLTMKKGIWVRVYLKGQTPRKGRGPMHDDTYKHGVTTLSTQLNEKETTLARHYYALIMKKYPTATAWMTSSKNLIVFTVDDTPVACVMPYLP